MGLDIFSTFYPLDLAKLSDGVFTKLVYLEFFFIYVIADDLALGGTGLSALRSLYFWPYSLIMLYFTPLIGAELA